MKWGRNYARRSYLRSSMWIVPVAAFVVSAIVIRLVAWLDDVSPWKWDWHIDIPVVQIMLQGMIGATLSFLVFTFSSLLVAIQVASAQLTPRIIATTLLRDPTIRRVVALFVLTLAFSLGTLARTQGEVPYFLLTCATILAAGSTVAFIYLIDYAARLLRPVTIVWRLGEDGIKAVEDVYPTRLPPLPLPPRQRVKFGEPNRVVAHQGVSAIVLAVDIDHLMREAERTDGLIEVCFQVGDFIAVGEPLYCLHGSADGADDRLLRGAIAFGRERTIDQDPTFAFRIIVDIALKALSKAINDPTTAVLALDQLHRLLRSVGRRHLRDEMVKNDRGVPRVFLHTPNWEDFVQLSCREIRSYGAENFQVARRLRAMIENLIAILPEVRHAALRTELDLLDKTLERLGMLPEDLELARTPDVKGLGSSAAR
jgi:uncharacterized membrane protein